MSLVVDASFVIKWFVPESGSDAASRLLASERSVYDSMYVALALRLDTRLITADERFFHALQSFPDLAGSIELLALTA